MNINYFRDVIEPTYSGKAVKATLYINTKEIIRAVRTRYGGKFAKGNIEINLSVCKPNFAEREYLKKNKDYKFPLLFIKPYNPKKTKLKRNL